MSRFVTCCALFLLFVNFCGCTELLEEKSTDNADKQVGVRHGCGITNSKPFKNETCIFFRHYEASKYSEAENECTSWYKGNLVAIDSDEKQKFVEDFIKPLELKENVWLGLKYIRDSNTYQWPYERLVNYSNWKDGYPKNDPEYCVEFETSPSEFGKWSEKLCEEKRTILLCEVIQKWSDNEVQARLLFLIKDKDQLETKMKELENKNVIPIGFIYVELPFQKPPTEIWPFYNWENVSHKYSGMFFRVEGGKAAKFGTIQGESSPKISGAWTFHENYNYDIIFDYKSSATPSLITGGEKGKDRSIRFSLDGSEVKPRNMAMRIWKRIP